MRPGKRHPVEEAVAQALIEVKGLLIAGVSGGADSVALLHALHRLDREVMVVNCNFHLRGEESNRDSTFVVQLANRLRIPLIARDFDVADYMRRHGGSVEMACRELRYRLFREVVQREGAMRIAVAHNADDNAETLLLNLMRGAGIRGLRGMIPDTGEIIRPLLSVSRAQILDYLASLGAEYVVDSSNLTDDYRRNFLRLKVLPLLETRWPEAKSSIEQTQRNLRAEERIIEEATRVEGPLLSWQRIAEAADARTLIHRFTLPLAPTSAQIEEIKRLAAAPFPGKRWLTPVGSINAERDGLHLVRNDDSADLLELRTFRLPYNKDIAKLMRSFRRPTALFLPSPPESYTIRFPQTGDRIRPLGMRGSSLVSDVLKDAHLERQQKEHTRLIINSSGEIIWVENLKRSRFELVPDEATEVFVIASEPETISLLEKIEKNHGNFDI